MHPDRLAVVIGKHGETKKYLEKLTGTKIKISSETGDYHIEPNHEVSTEEMTEEIDTAGVRVYTAHHVLKAINFGFSPENALTLLEGDNFLEVIDLEKILGLSNKKVKRIKGRIIGDQGKIRNSIEQFSGVKLSIYQRYLAIIGEFSGMKIAKKAINMLIQGSPHKTVLSYLQYEHQKVKQEEFTQMWKPVI